MRIRTVKPEWLDDEKLALASPAVRVASIALILLADDYGCGRGNEAILISRIFPGDSRRFAEHSEMGRSALTELCEMGFLRFYRVRGQRYFTIVNWKKHQRVDKPGMPRIPLPSAPDAVYEDGIRETPAKVRECLAPDLGPRTRDLDQDHGTSTPPFPPSPAKDADRSQCSQDQDRSQRSQDQDRSQRSQDQDRSQRSQNQELEHADLAEFKRWRKTWGIQQEDIAKALHCKRTQYSAWERGADDCPDHIREQLAQYRTRIESHDADKRHALATTAITWLNSKTGARYQATSEQVQSAARQWLKWGWTANRIVRALERASAAIDKQWWRPQTLFQSKRLSQADEENQANAPVARFGEQTNKQTPTVGYAEPSHPDEFVGGKRDLGPILQKLKQGEQL